MFDTDGIQLRPSINGLVTDRNTKFCCRGFVSALFQSTTANKIDSERTQDYTAQQKFSTKKLKLIFISANGFKL